MRINNNISAVNSYRIATVVNNDSSKAVKKLSSGYRINGASDDAAGLSISEKMRAQIRGVAQASRNIQDGISLIQTAEGALDTVHSILQRGRELAVQAANGTNTDADKKMIQAEIDQLSAEVDRIGNTTEFNQKKLLNVGAPTGTLTEIITNGLKSGWLESGASMIQAYYGLTPSSRTIDVVFQNGAPLGELASIQSQTVTVGNTTSVTKMTLNIDLTDFAPGTGPDGENAVAPMYNDRIITHEMVHAIMADQMGDDFFDMPTWFQEGAAEFIHGADERVATVGAGNAVSRAANLIDGTAAWTGSDEDYAGAYVAMKFIYTKLTPGESMSTLFGAIQDGNDANDNTMGAILSKTGYASVAALKADINATGAGILNLGDADTGSISGSDHGGAVKDARAVIANGAYSDNPTNFNFLLPEFNNPDANLSFQVGANTGQYIEVKLAKISAASLGIDAIDVIDDAGLSISKYDSAITSVSDLRSQFGAVQNRLEHMLKSSNNYEENITASESRIRDVDMAKEMMKFTKLDILKQAATAMMAQANQRPQGILQLVRA